jgi:predicted NUDIX family phosphoesterase
LVVRTEQLLRQEALAFQGFRPGNPTLLQDTIARYGFFTPRPQAEGDSSLKQVILYLVLRYRRLLFLYQRLNATTENRLMHKYSIGLGGHINPVDRCPISQRLLGINLLRELTEEVRLAGRFSYRVIGAVNDDQSEVGRYHIGIVFLISSASPEVAIRETEKLSGSMAPIDRVLACRPSLETWSGIILDGVCKMILQG